MVFPAISRVAKRERGVRFAEFFAALGRAQNGRHLAAGQPEFFEAPCGLSNLVRSSKQSIMSSSSSHEKIRVSTITPVYAGADYLEDLVEEIGRLRKRWLDEDAPVLLEEAIFVDDEAIDDSARILDRLEKTHDWVRVIHLSRNFGQHPATIAGVLHSSGEWLVTLDEDLQHPPREIPSLLAEAVLEHHDVVYASALVPVHESWLRDLGSRGFKALMHKATGNQHIGSFNSFRLMRGAVARAAASVCAHETYFDIVLGWFTTRIGVLAMALKDDRYIRSGASGYSLRKLLSHARRMAVTSHSKLLRGGAFVGTLALGTAVVYGAVVGLQRLLSPESIPVQGWTSLFLTVLFFGGILSLLIGVVIEYLAVVMLHTQGKPTFFVIDRSSDYVLRPYFSERRE
jgi:glycosyltransferase involved in cell wall biosynthesis